MIVTETDGGRSSGLPSLLLLDLVLVDLDEPPAADAEPPKEPEDGAAAPAVAGRKTIQFDTPTADIKAIFLKMYDDVMGVVQEIPEVELPYSRDEAFELRLQNDGAMPTFYLRAPQLAESLIQDVRSHIDQKMTDAMKPLEEFLTLFEPYIPFIQLDVQKFVSDLGSDETKGLPDMRAEVDYHREQQVRNPSLNILTQSPPNPHLPPTSSSPDPHLTLTSPHPSRHRI